MTLDEFIAEIEPAGWQGIYGVNVGIRCGRIDQNESWCCPVTYVAKKRTGRRFGVNDTETAAGYMGLSQEDRKAIVMAADTSEESELRERLLKACGLV